MGSYSSPYPTHLPTSFTQGNSGKSYDNVWYLNHIHTTQRVGVRVSD